MNTYEIPREVLHAMAESDEYQFLGFGPVEDQQRLQQELLNDADYQEWLSSVSGHYEPLFDNEGNDRS